MLLGDSAQFFCGGGGGNLNTHGLGQAGVDAQPLPLAGQVDGTGFGFDLVYAHSVGAGHDDFLHALGHDELVGVSFVAFQGGEFGAVGGVYALVAEDTANFVDAFQAAYLSALEEELGGNAQGHRLVKGVQVGFEGAGCRTTVNELQDGGFQLDVAVVVQHVTHGLGDLGALDDQVAGFVAHHQVEVALADAGLFVQVGV